MQTLMVHGIVRSTAQNPHPCHPLIPPRTSPHHPVALIADNPRATRKNGPSRQMRNNCRNPSMSTQTPVNQCLAHAGFLRTDAQKPVPPPPRTSPHCPIAVIADNPRATRKNGPSRQMRNNCRNPSMAPQTTANQCLATTEFLRTGAQKPDPTPPRTSPHRPVAVIADMYARVPFDTLSHLSDTLPLPRRANCMQHARRLHGHLSLPLQPVHRVMSRHTPPENIASRGHR